MKLALLFRVIFFTIIFIFLCFPALSYSQSTWFKIYNFEFPSSSNSIFKTFDNNYSVIGHASRTVILIKVNEDGDTLLKKICNEVRLLEMHSAEPIIEQGYILTGIDDSNFSLPCIIKIDLDGNLIWKRTYGTNKVSLYTAVSTNDGGYIIAGSIFPEIEFRRFVLLIKTDAAGDTLWTRTYDFSESFDEAYSIRQTIDGDFIVGGGNHNGQAWIMKIDSLGNILWKNNYIGNLGSPNAIRICHDGSFIMGGCSKPEGFSTFLVKVAANGDTEWEKTYNFGLAYGAYSVIQTTSYGFVLVGNIFEGSSDLYWEYIFLLKTDSLGNKEWSQVYGHKDYSYVKYECRSIVQSFDGGYLLAGRKWGQESNRGIMLIKTDSLGNTSGIPVKINVEPNIPVATTLFQNYPNPFNPVTTIRFDLLKSVEVQLIVYDVLGQEISILVNKKLPAGRHEVEWDAVNYSSGIYFYRLTADRFNEVKKIVLLK